ncbi:G-type lectin S-receptor-like serine/threonine-protein kinase LECRK3 [Eucalyptus grandis]|uniref:G-type lectin S-receptor-like serine/threonine-protein kinase LECRK3 n=1 Tax=Eucalyptus grandis TaxID=71139 RepID=UPI0005252D5E|nr:G-type lectin S-receptor-like serine/threonine-protein kinase LECRK3 [Eucalyptus grandis]
MASSYIILIFLLTGYCAAVGSEKCSISLNSAIHPITHPTSWTSPSGHFAFGFYQEGGGFKVGIWMVRKSQNTTVWTANRDDPPVSSNAALELTPDGQLVLKIGPGETELIANSSDSASCAAMDDAGNFILYNQHSEVIWQSFNFPTDTLLGGQSLPTGAELHSSVSWTNHSTGRFRLRMQYDNNLVLYPKDTLTSGIDAYWASNTCCYVQPVHFHLYLNFTGALLLLDNSGEYAVISDLDTSSVNHNSTIYRLILDSGGILQLYSHRFAENGDDVVSLMWTQPDNKCGVKGLCGFNSYCTMEDEQPVCRCFPGTDYVDSTNQFSGCERNFKEEWCRDARENSSSFTFKSIDQVYWQDPPYFQVTMEVADCNMSCLEDCDCEVALYDFKKGTCMKQKLPLMYAWTVPEKSFRAFFKVGLEGIEAANTNNSNSLVLEKVDSKKETIQLLLVTVGLTACSCIALAVAGLFTFKLRVLEYKKIVESGNFGLTEELALRPFSYKELKRATNGFKEELGKGSFGAVYKGTLYRGKRVVAVKRLEKLLNEGEREFRAEMSIIGTTNHRHLVRLLGFCAEASKRLLVYEYMSNGSLADLLFRSERHPDWNERMRIALEIARGILYLHEECDTPIIHCDIKPQNILMDDFWAVKISDFGLAKLLMPDQTRTFTVIRGTRGYMAPEWHKGTPISVKTDVYSYGIMLLEIVFCRRHMDVNASTPEEIVLSSWVYGHFRDGELDKLVLGEEVDKWLLEKLVKVSLWCIQDEPALRPSMKSVVMMLDGTTEISVPPCPTAATV